MASLQDVHQQSYSDMPFDDFAQKYHQKFYGDMPFDQFMSKAGGAAPQPDREVIAEDPIKATVRQEIGEMRSKGVPTDDGYGRQVLQGMTFGGADEVLAGLSTPLEMIKRRTFNPIEGYNYAKAREDILLEDARKRGGITGSVAEGVGGVLTGGSMAKAGATFVPAATVVNGAAKVPGIASTVAGLAADGAAYGGVTGFLEGSGLNDRLSGAGKGAAIGAGIGAALPLAARGIGTAAAPLINPIMARRFPEAYSGAKLLEAYKRSGMTPDDLARSLTDAAGEGQGMFTVADAMGNAGQRMLSAVARIPQNERQALVESLERRQGDQGRRLGAFLRDGFDAPHTAQQTEQALGAQRAASADVNYAPVKSDPSSIDVSSAVAAANRSISPLADRTALAQGRVPTDLAARQATEIGESSIRDPIREAVKEARSYLASPTLTINNVEKAFRAKTNIDTMIAKATEVGQGAKVAELIPIRDALDETLARTSRQYSGARDAYRADSRVIDAVGQGKNAARGGLLEDNIQTFSNLGNEAERGAFRSGYADPLISSVQNASHGTNKARGLLTTATEAEFPRFAAPGRGDQMARRIGREQTMFETRAQALGGSKTADNLADSADLKAIDPSVLTNLLGGNYLSAGKAILSRGSNEVSGMSPAVAERLSRALMESNAGRARDGFTQALESVKRTGAIKNNLIRGLLSGGLTTSAPYRK